MHRNRKTPRRLIVPVQRACTVLIAMTGLIGVGTPAEAVTIISQSANTQVFLNDNYTTIEFENPLSGSETVHGYRVLEWRDADYQSPAWYDDWTVSHPGSIDGNVNEIWMRQNGHAIWTSTTVISDAVSIHLHGDGNDGIAQVMVDGSEVARLDMGSNPPQNAVVLVTRLASSTHTIRVSDLGMGTMGTDVATLGVCTLRSGAVYKWHQPPQPGTPSNVYFGWNEPSILYFGPIVADDWVCIGNQPVTTIRWWGSHLGWREPAPPPQLPDFFWLTIWTDVPGGAAGEPFSHPGVVLWQYQTGRIDPVLAGWDYDPRTAQFESCFEYRVDLPPDKYFCQNPATNQILWLSVAAAYVDVPQIEYPWGWKTRPRDPTSPAPDDAVRVFEPVAPQVGMQYVAGDPIWWPVETESWDTAFELYSGPVDKWVQPPDLTGLGIDVNCTAPMMFPPPPVLLADDFKCIQPGVVTRVSVWGSWRNDYLPFGGDPLAVQFTLSIHADVPAGQQEPWSMPGNLLWMREFGPGSYGVFPVPLNEPEGWFNPPSEFVPVGDFTCWRYDFVIPPMEAFHQEGSPAQPITYWLDVQARPLDPQAFFGWKTSQCHWNDDAAWVNGIEPYFGIWNELRYPPPHPLHPESIDLAFMIGSDPVMPQPPELKWSQPPTPWTTENGFNGWNELSWFGGPQIVADDWVCTTDQPVTDVHWWGSFLGWDQPYAPPDMPVQFHIAVWTDVPADPGGGTPWSHPGTVIWENYCDTFTAEFVGWDFDPRNPLACPEACYKFEQLLPDEGWFYQRGPYNIYWISIAAIYPPGMIVEHPWGWKSTPRLDAQSPDDAVRIFDPVVPGIEITYQAGEPIWWPTFDQSWDMAFALTTIEQIEPDADLGDAPDSSNNSGAAMTAYPAGGPPGVIAHYPTVHLAGSPPFGPIHRQPRNMAYLGTWVTLEQEADIGLDEDFVNNIDPPSDQPDMDFSDDAVVLPLSLPHCMPTTFQYTITVVSPVAIPMFVNVWFDWNRDGDWDDVMQCPNNVTAPEWAVRNQVPAVFGPGTYTLTTPPFVSWHPASTPQPDPIWMRITLSEMPWSATGGAGYGGSGPLSGYQYGETEDYYFVPDVPPPVETKWIQRPHDMGQGFDAASSYWWNEGVVSPVNRVVADDFISDGRPIRILRWWGSYLDDRYAPEATPDQLHVLDGWFISFHWAHPGLSVADCPPNVMFDPPPTVLGVYYAPAAAVHIERLPMLDCFQDPVYVYTVDLSRCCLLCREIDPRFPTDIPPATPFDFRERGAARYWLDVQAVVGVTWNPPACSFDDRILTGHIPSELEPDGQFWGWHTSPANVMPQGPLAWACVGQIVNLAPYPQGCWNYGNWMKQPWLCLTAPPPQVDMAFILYADRCLPLGDVNRDGLVNALDIQCFTDCIMGYTIRPCWCGCGEMNSDLVVNVGDITPFVDLLLSL